MDHINKGLPSISELKAIIKGSYDEFNEISGIGYKPPTFPHSPTGYMDYVEELRHIWRLMYGITNSSSKVAFPNRLKAIESVLARVGGPLPTGPVLS